MNENYIRHIMYLVSEWWSKRMEVERKIAETDAQISSLQANLP